MSKLLFLSLLLPAISSSTGDNNRRKGILKTQKSDHRTKSRVRFSEQPLNVEDNIQKDYDLAETLKRREQAERPAFEDELKRAMQEAEKDYLKNPEAYEQDGEPQFSFGNHKVPVSLKHGRHRFSNEDPLIDTQSETRRYEELLW